MAEFAVPVGALYPVQLDIDYPERQSRWKAVFRLPLAIPVLLFSALMQYAMYGALWLLWIVILIRGRIPHWLFEFFVATNRGIVRANAYFTLLTDVYPPFEGGHPVHFEVRYPERIARRKLLFWKLITSLPHLFVLQVLSAASLAVLPIAWIAVIFSQRFPKGLHEFLTGILRWQQRVNAYLLSLTDEFPPYSTSADARAGSGRSQLFSAIAGLVLLAAAIGGITALVIYVVRHSEQEISVSYQRLVDGTALPGENSVIGRSLAISLDRAYDPADARYTFLQAGERKHLVAFDMAILDTKNRTLLIDEFNFRLKDSQGHGHRPFLALANKRTLPLKLGGREEANVELVFEVDDDAVPTELHYSAVGRFLKTLVYKFDQ